MEKITANMRRLTITTQESGARLREPGRTLLISIKMCRNFLLVLEASTEIDNYFFRRFESKIN